MANAGRFKDRNPTLLAAGVPNHFDHTVAECFNDYGSPGAIYDALVSSLPVKKEHESYVAPGSKNRYNAYSYEAKLLINPEKKGFYESLCDELKETSYKSYWNAALGQVPDPVPGLPLGMNAKTTTMGRKGLVDPKSSVIGDIVNPRLTPGQVLFESSIGKELYKKSHNLLEPGERKYRFHDVDLNLIHGKPTFKDTSGKRAKMCTEWFDQSPYSATSKDLSAFKYRHQHQVGKVLAPNNNISKVGLNHRFGIATKSDFVGAGEIMRGIEPNEERVEYLKCVSYVNRVRIAITKFQPTFLYFDFEKTLRYADKDNSGYLSIDDILSIWKKYGVKLDLERLWPLLEKGNYIKDSMINYEKLSQLILPIQDLPELNLASDVPPEHLSYESIYQSFMNDVQKKLPPECIPSAGLTTKELSTLKGAPNLLTLIDKINLGDETSAATCINPHVFIHYGLSHRDFFRPRTQEFIKDLFNKIGTEIPENVFQEFWKIALERDKTGYVCIETFRNILSEVIAAKFAQQFR